MKVKHKNTNDIKRVNEMNKFILKLFFEHIVIILNCFGMFSEGVECSNIFPSKSPGINF